MRPASLLLILALGAVTLFAAPALLPRAHAQATGAGAGVISSLRVDVWPEHDDPRVLVVYRGMLADTVALPHPLAFVIPAGSQVNAAAYRQDGRLLMVRYQVQPEATGTQILFTVPEREFQFEYYADVISGRPQRAFALDLTFPLPVVTLEVAVEEPLRVTDFALSPVPGNTAEAGGFTYYLFSETQWPAGKIYRLRASYRKGDTEPSVLRPSPGPVGAGPAGLPPQGGAAFPWALPALGGFLIGAAAVGAIWMLRANLAGRGPAKARRRRGGGG